jgi:hypothetical protein
VLGVLSVQGQLLDMRYLRSYSEKLGLAEILQKAVDEAHK